MMNNGMTSLHPEEDLGARQVWFVPRRIMCAIFWLSNVLLFTGIILLVTGKHKGPQSSLYRAWGGVLLGLGFCLILSCFILCVHAYCIITVDAVDETLYKNTPPPPLCLSRLPQNGFDGHHEALGFKPKNSNDVLVPIETCFDHHMEASLHPPPPSYSQCSIHSPPTKQRDDRGNGYVTQREISQRAPSPIWKEAPKESPTAAPNTPSASFERRETALARTPSSAKIRRENFSNSRTCDWVNETNKSPARGCSSFPSMSTARTRAPNSSVTSRRVDNPNAVPFSRVAGDAGDAPARFYVATFDSSSGNSTEDVLASRAKRSEYGSERVNTVPPSKFPSAKTGNRFDFPLTSVAGRIEAREGGAQGVVQDMEASSGMLKSPSDYDNIPSSIQYGNTQPSQPRVDPTKLKHFEV